MVAGHGGVEGLRVLVVEPKHSVAARLKSQLEGLGHRVLALAKDGREAVAAAHRLRPNLILMETALVGIDGIDAARAIVDDEPVPIILLMGYAGSELVRRAREAGVVAYLTSVDRRRLTATIDVALERFGEYQLVRKEGSDPREVLAARRAVDRAKRVLTTRLRLSEAEAFRHLLDRQQSTRRTLRETASAVVGADRALGRPEFGPALQLILHSIRRGLRRPQ
jgi:response regulator NasT